MRSSSHCESNCAPPLCGYLPCLPKSKDDAGSDPASGSPSSAAAAEDKPPAVQKIEEAAAATGGRDDDDDDDKGYKEVTVVSKSCLKRPNCADSRKDVEKGNVKWRDLLGKDLTQVKEFEPRAPRDDFIAAGIDLNLEPPLEDEIDLNPVPPAQAPAQDDNANALQGRKEVSNEVRNLIFQTCLARSTDGTKLKRHVTREVAQLFEVSIQTVQRIWKKGKSSIILGTTVDVSSGRRKCGRKRVPIDLSVLRNIPFKDRTTLEDVCAILHISKSKLLRLKREGLIKRHTNSIKPYLTEANKKARLQWSVDMLDQDSMPDNPKFKGLFDVVYIDEKWFYLTRKSEGYYILPDEDVPHRTCKSKNNIPKIMFLTVVARPRFDSNGVCIFYGKIGCFPLVTYEPAKRSSVNRPAGTMEIKPIPSIKKEVIRDFMIEKVLPAIRAKWPVEDRNKPIFIQQDNAPSHLDIDDPIFAEAAAQDGFDIRLISQPANSPDFNVLDLGFFRAIQSIQYKKAAKTIADLVPIVQQSFQEYSTRKANRIFLTLHCVLKEAMKVGGGNNFKIPHIKKGTLERLGCLPLQINCEPSLIAQAMTKLAE